MVRLSSLRKRMQLKLSLLEIVVNFGNIGDGRGVMRMKRNFHADWD